MLNTYSIYKNKIEENKRNFFLLLERLKKSYPQYKLNPRNQEYSSIYNGDKQQVETIFQNLFSIENEIQKNANKYETDIIKKENILRGDKDYYNKEKERYDELNNNARASVPREKEYNYKLTLEQIICFIHLFGITIGSYYLYKVLK